MNLNIDNKMIYIKTIGCQMNVYDSEQIILALHSIGYVVSNDFQKATLIVLNTCSVRNKAEQKALSFLGKISSLKKKNPSLIIAVGGCVAQEKGKKILKRFKEVDLVFGTNAIFRITDLISRIEFFKCKIVDTSLSINSEYKYKKNAILKNYKNRSISSFVTIMRGCNNYCTYCIVPYVRGNEVSRCSDDIVKDVKMLANLGTKEIILLGQNVNSYGKKENMISFSKLLEKVNEINDIARIRFITSHPKDLSNELIRAFIYVNKLCKHIHLPVQSGDDNILRKMNRKYSTKEFLGKINDLRYVCPNITISSDVIVGFPGESQMAFDATLNLVKQVEFDNLFIFSYSDRPRTGASKMYNKVSRKDKVYRLQKLLLIQRSISMKKNYSMIGKIQSVLIEGRREDIFFELGVFFGRTSGNKIVDFKASRTQVFHLETGKLVNVLITGFKAHCLHGKMV